MFIIYNLWVSKVGRQVLTATIAWIMKPIKFNSFYCVLSVYDKQKTRKKHNPYRLMVSDTGKMTNQTQYKPKGIKVFRPILCVVYGRSWYLILWIIVAHKLKRITAKVCICTTKFHFNIYITTTYIHGIMHINVSIGALFSWFRVDPSSSLTTMKN